ncbi:hypothetical protein BCAH1134_C0571 (plasmid) [Bacillus cereus AH1134]|nr:hypothetical protein BCAH1134_C0571 [Bacillus cereus AH1134]
MNLLGCQVLSVPLEIFKSIKILAYFSPLASKENLPHSFGSSQ